MSGNEHFLGYFSNATIRNKQKILEIYRKSNCKTLEMKSLIQKRILGQHCAMPLFPLILPFSKKKKCCYMTEICHTLFTVFVVYFKKFFF